MYRSAPYLETFYREVCAAASELTDDFELILVNDGSPDDSLDVALSLYEADSRVRVIDLSRNFGHHKAMMTGLAHAQGERVFLIDCDLEIRPAVLADFAAEMQQTGADVVYGVQAVRHDALFDRLAGESFYLFFNWLSNVPLPRNLLTTRLMTRRYVQALVQHREREVLIGGLWEITGFKQVSLVIDKAVKGSTTYSIRRRITIVVNAVTSFSNKPLVLIFYLGSLISLLSLLAASYLVVRRIFFGELLTGWPSLIVSIWLLGGLTILCLGVIGIYLAKIFTEVKQRPYTIIRCMYDHRTYAADMALTRTPEYVNDYTVS
jgi:putative glycosyltransferase